MKYAVGWTPEADDSFSSIILYLKENWSNKEIDNFISSTEKTISFISENPKLFRKTNLKNVREALIAPHTLLIYKIYPEQIVLLLFWDTRRNPKTKFKK